MKKSRNTITRLIFVLLLLLAGIACHMGKEDKRVNSGNNSASTASTNEAPDTYIEAGTWRSWSPPNQLSGYSIKSFVTDPYKLNGLYSASARYEKGEKWLNLQIVDGESDKGKNEIRDHLEIAELQRNDSSEYGYEKTLERKGIKAREEYLSPPAGQYLIRFMLTEQYGVSVKSNAVTAAEIWDLIDQLKLEELGK